MIDSPSKFEFDRLKMYFGDPYKVHCDVGEIVISTPTIGDILQFGEKEFYSMLNIFVSNPTSYRLQLCDMGVDWNKISDYELFCMLIKGLDTEATKLLFGDVNFQMFDLYNKKLENSDEQVLTLYNQEQNIEITEDTYRCIFCYFNILLLVI